MERETKPLSELNALQARSFKIDQDLSKAETVSRVVGTADFNRRFDLSSLQGEGFLEKAVKVGRIREALQERAIPKLLSQKEEVEKQIKYSGRIQKASEDVERIRGFVQKGVLPIEALDKAQAALEDIKQQHLVLPPPAQIIPTLSGPIEVARVTEEVEKAPRIIISEEARSIQVDGRTVRLPSNIQWSVFLYLAQNPNKDISSKEIGNIAEKAGSSAKFPARDAIQRLRLCIESNPKKPQLITRSGSMSNSKYRLNTEVKFVEVTMKTAQEEPPPAKIEPEEVEILRKIKVNKGTQEVLFGNKVVKLDGEIDWAVFIFLADNAGREIPYKDISEAAIKAGSRGKRISGNAVYSLKRKLEDDYKNPQLIITAGNGNNTRYRLNTEVEFVEASEEVTTSKPEKPGESREFPRIPVHESRIQASVLYLDNITVEDISSVIEQIINILGPSEKTGQWLTPNQAMFALGRTANRLYIRNFHKIIESYELSLWERIKDSTGKKEDRDALTVYWKNLKTWFKKEKQIEEEVEPISEAEIKVEPLSDEEAAILGSILHLRASFMDENKIEKMPVYLVERLIGRIQSSLNLDPVQLNQSRIKALDKVQKILKSDKLDEIFDQQNPDTQELLLYFIGIDPEQYSKMKELLISSTESYWQEQMGIIIKFWQELKARPKEGKSTIALPDSVGRKPEKRFKLEQRDPNIREKINEIFDLIESRNLPNNPRGSQLPKYFSELKETVVDGAIEKGYISPDTDKHGFPTFNREEIAVLVYIAKFGNSFKARLAKELREIVTQESLRRKRESKEKVKNKS